MTNAPHPAQADYATHRERSAPWLTMLVTTLVVLLSGCTTTPKKNADSKVAVNASPLQLNGRYQNTALDFSMQFDSKWHFFTEEPIVRKELESGLSIKSDAEEQRVAIFSRFTPDKPSQFNDNITITAEHSNVYPSVTTSSEYLILLRDTLRRSQSKIQFKNLYLESIQGTEYAVLPITYSVYGIKVHQKHFATVKDGKIIDFILTYAVKNSEGDLVAMMKSVNFGEPTVAAE